MGLFGRQMGLFGPWCSGPKALPDCRGPQHRRERTYAGSPNMKVERISTLYKCPLCSRYVRARLRANGCLQVTFGPIWAPPPTCASLQQAPGAHWPCRRLHRCRHCLRRDRTCHLPSWSKQQGRCAAEQPPDTMTQRRAQRGQRFLPQFIVLRILF